MYAIVVVYGKTKSEEPEAVILLDTQALLYADERHRRS